MVCAAAPAREVGVPNRTVKGVLWSQGRVTRATHCQGLAAPACNSGISCCCSAGARLRE